LTLFQDKQDGKNQRRKNETAQSKIKEGIFGNNHSLPHFIAIIRAATAETNAARAAIKPETATTHVAAFARFSPFCGSGSSFFFAILKYNPYLWTIQVFGIKKQGAGIYFQVPRNYHSRV
jgi:hypothetical protein